MKRIITFCAILCSGMTMAQNNFGDIIGTLVDKADGTGLPDIPVITFNGEAKYEASTDPDGRFRMSAIPSGEYKIYFLVYGDTLSVDQYVEVTPDGIGDIGKIAWSEPKGSDLPTFEVVYDRDALHLKKGAVPETKITGLDLRNSASKFDAKGMIIAVSSEVKRNDDGQLVFRGARAGDMICYLDGVKLPDVPQLPSAAYKYMMVYTGAIPAKYGDTNGGVVVIETNTYMDLYNDWKRKMSSASLKD